MLFYHSPLGSWNAPFIYLNLLEHPRVYRSPHRTSVPSSLRWGPDFESCIYTHPLPRSEAVDGQAGGGRHAGRDEGGEEEDGHGEKGVHPGALSLTSLPPTHRHRHRSAALPAALWDQCSESGVVPISSSESKVSRVCNMIVPLARFSTTPLVSS